MILQTLPMIPRNKLASRRQNKKRAAERNERGSQKSCRQNEINIYKSISACQFRWKNIPTWRFGSFLRYLCRYTSELVSFVQICFVYVFKTTGFERIVHSLDLEGWMVLVIFNTILISLRRRVPYKDTLY